MSCLIDRSIIVGKERNMASMDNDECIQGYLYEPQTSDFQHLCRDSTDSSDLSESDHENVAVNWRLLHVTLTKMLMLIL